MYHPSRQEFRELAARGNVVPVYRQLLADSLTPVLAYSRIVDEGVSSFLLESVTGGENIGRYSFLGSGPRRTIKVTGARAEIQEAGHPARDVACDDPYELLRREMADYRWVPVDGLPPFTGGLVGYFAYDVVRYVERLPDTPPDELGLPDFHFGFYDTILIFDHVSQTLKVVANGFCEGRSPDEAYDEAVGRIESLVKRLRRPGAEVADDIYVTDELSLPVESNFTREAFMSAVEKCKEYIYAGDIFQVVLSQRLCTPRTASPFALYRLLRVVNPSPYMFLLELDGVELIGSSPEVMVKVVGEQVSMRPIAGTRPRGKTHEEDVKLAEELLADPKECAEHVMLLDLGRNDVGRIADYGSVVVDERMIIERYSHVMHITSNVVGRLAEGRDAFDALRACMPAGTVSGAPKVRAMQIIDELEPVKRGPYAGAVGYIDFSGNMDTCITLRTIALTPDKAIVQAGAGIVADSVPEREYEETLNKARGMLKTIEMAGRGFNQKS